VDAIDAEFVRRREIIGEGDRARSDGAQPPADSAIAPTPDHGR